MIIKNFKKYFTITNPKYLKDLYENNIDKLNFKHDDIIVNKINTQPLIRLISIGEDSDFNSNNLKYINNLLDKENTTNFFSFDPINYIFWEKKLDLALRRSISKFELKENKSYEYFPTHWMKTMIDKKVFQNYYLFKNNIKIEDENKIDEYFQNIPIIDLTNNMKILLFGEENEINNFSYKVNSLMIKNILSSTSGSFLVGLNETFMRMKLMRLVNGEELLNNFLEYCIVNKKECNNLFVLGKQFLNYDKSLINAILIKSLINDFKKKFQNFSKINEINIILDEITYEFLNLIIDDNNINETWDDLHFKMLNSYNNFNIGKIMNILGIIDSISSTQYFNSKYIKDPFFFWIDYDQILKKEDFEDLKKNFFLGYKKAEFFKEKLIKEYNFINDKNYEEKIENISDDENKSISIKEIN